MHKNHENNRRRRAWSCVAALLVSTLLVTLSGTPASAAGFPIGGKILEEYNQSGVANGYPNGVGFLGDAITKEADASRGGRFQKFYKNSSIYWHPLVSGGHANQIGGLIRDKWINELGYEDGPLKYPTTRELAARKPGRYNKFEGGNLYWSSNTGAHPVWGQILNIWGGSDYEAGQYGFPTTDEFQCAEHQDDDVSPGDYGGFGQKFENGWIVWNTESFYNKSNSIVSANSISYGIQSSAAFQSQIRAGISTWQNLGRINFVEALPAEPDRTPPLLISSENSPDEEFAGLYYDDHRPPLNDTKAIALNTAFIYSANNARNVVTHELGHALGLEHSCQGQLMDEFDNDKIFTPQYMDLRAYHDLWG